MPDQVSKAAFAREAGVSTTTLTRYLGGQSVADETREAIEKAAKTLGIDVTATEDGSPAHPELQRPPVDDEPELEVVAPEAEAVEPEPEPEPALPPEATPPAPPEVDLTAKVKEGKLDESRSFRVLTVEETGKPRVGTSHTHTLLIETATKAGTQQKKIALDEFPTYGKVLELAE